MGLDMSTSAPTPAPKALRHLVYKIPRIRKFGSQRVREVGHWTGTRLYPYLNTQLSCGTCLLGAVGSHRTFCDQS